MLKRIQLSILGRVQGVFFRAEAARIARSLGVSGLVQNLPDGSVQLIGEGEEAYLLRLIEWCRKGPPGARVEEVRIDWSEALGTFSDFKIR